MFYSTIILFFFQSACVVPKRGPNYCSALRREDGCITINWDGVTLVEAGGIITGYNIYLERFTSFTCAGVEIVAHRDPIVLY